MYLDSDGNFAISIFIAGIIIGGILGGVTRGAIAYNDGARGWDLVGEIAIGTATGMVIGGAAGGVAAAGGAFLAGGVSSVFSKFTTDLFALTAFGTPISSWEDYAIAFTFGGLSQGLFGKGPSLGGGLSDILVRPAVNQLVKIGTGRQKEFQWDKYGYDIVTRGLTYGMKGPWKSFARGGIRGYWDYYRKGYFSN
jgi:hypothetical protein